ncbi:MAG: hypothetical protein JSR85_04260 [Proteobacteria bacterium]|nr:hypothetical protein [Pseudomonadota bacterium]
MANGFFNFSTFSSYLALSVVLGTGPLFAMNPDEEMFQAAIAASLRDTGEAPAPIEDPQARTRKHLALFGDDDEAMLQAAMAASLQSGDKGDDREDTSAARATSGSSVEQEELGILLSKQNYPAAFTSLRGTVHATCPDEDIVKFLLSSNGYLKYDALSAIEKEWVASLIIVDTTPKSSTPPRSPSPVPGSADEPVDVLPLGGIPLTSYVPTGMFGAEPYHAFVTHYPTMAAKGNLLAVVFDLLSRLGDGPKSVVFDVDNTLWARDDAFLDDRNTAGTRLTNIEWPDVLIALKEAGHIVDLVTARSGREAQNVERDLATSGIRLGEHYRAVYATQDATKQNFVERCAEGRELFFLDDNLSNNLTVAKHFERLGIPVLSVNVGTLENFGNAEIKMTAEFLASEL